MLALAPPGIILDKMSFNGSLQREWLLLHHVAVLGSGAAAVESAADSVVSRSLGCGGGLG
eukprot:jgi/Chrpa1/27596/Chrysochromulina_OHIO_Genome00027238-RA